MAFFIFENNQNNISGTLYRIAENQYDLDNLNITNLSTYKIIQDTQENFNAVKYGTKSITGYQNDAIIYVNIESTLFADNQYTIDKYISNFKNLIKCFLDNNKNSLLYSRWNNYYNQLSNLDTSSIPLPLNVSLEQYFYNLGQPSYNPLQLP